MGREPWERSEAGGVNNNEWHLHHSPVSSPTEELWKDKRRSDDSGLLFSFFCVRQSSVRGCFSFVFVYFINTVNVRRFPPTSSRSTNCYINILGSVFNCILTVAFIHIYINTAYAHAHTYTHTHTHTHTHTYTHTHTHTHTHMLVFMVYGDSP